MPWDAAENGDDSSLVAVLKGLLDDVTIQQGAGLTAPHYFGVLTSCGRDLQREAGKRLVVVTSKVLGSPLLR